jgi:hypothetical protein
MDEAFDQWWRAKEMAAGHDPDHPNVQLQRAGEMAAYRAATERAAGIADEAMTCECGDGFCECYGRTTIKRIARAIRGGG